MDYFLLIGVIVLAILAIGDLIVGVGNDAVNFLNSAIGSKVAPFRTIMSVATIGIFIGALSSAGMMEIAREGIFNPELFTVDEVLTIFLAVMLTDIFLLDAFNTIGMPTSTTVSIIFELLGASIIVSIHKILKNNEPMTWLFNTNNPSENIIGYLNWNKTSDIVSSIFLSVLIAFSFGALVMFISRVLFSFNYLKRIRTIGIVWASLAMLAMTYFLVYKGLKSTYSSKQLSKKEIVAYQQAINPMANTAINWGDKVQLKDLEGNPLVFTKVTTEEGKEKYEIFFGNKNIKTAIDYIKSQFFPILIGLFIFWIALFYLLIRYEINPFKIVVLAGTFSLAMAFAGNDLVNFIGVPLAGWQSFDLFHTANELSGESLKASEYKMIGLKFPIQTPYFYLIFAGLIMTLTLWFSKKARSVTETEVKLGTQEETQEKFNSNFISKAIVQGSIFFTSALNVILPKSLITVINKQFLPLVSDEKDAPAFDLIRAAVNLTMASMLIAIGTSLKLPLSTTYVTFMVAMGTSLADKAWGRETATYRIAGVINVIAGWFITAIIAFLVSGLAAFILLKLGIYGLGLLVIALLLVILKTNYYHKTQQERKEKTENIAQTIDLSAEDSFQKTAKEISTSLNTIIEAYQLTIDGILQEDKSLLKKAKHLNTDLTDFYADIKTHLFKAIKKSKLNDKQTAQLYILSNDMMQDILQSLTLIIETTDHHIQNSHKPLLENQRNYILKIKMEVISYLRIIIGQLERNDFSELKETKTLKRSIFDHIEASLSNQVEGITKKEYGFKNTDLILRILLETKDLVAIAVRFSKLLNRLNKGQSSLGNRNS